MEPDMDQDTLNTRLLDELTLRRRVIVTAPSYARSRHAFDAFVRFAGEAGQVVKVHRTNGHESVERGDGRVMFGPPGTRWRGYSADTLVMIDAVNISDQAREEMVPTIMASANPLVVEL
jgi:hypothetical protein